MIRTRIWIMLLVVIATVQFYVTNHCFRGYLRDPAFLAKELKTPLDSLDDYQLIDEAPFKYRLLFPGIVSTTYAAVFDEPDARGFYHTYSFWSLFFYVTSAIAFFFLLSECGFTQVLCFTGSIVFLLLPAMLLAFTLPVHTREDTLAYTLFFLGLVTLIRKRWTLFLLITLLGIAVRETLMLLPFICLFFVRDWKWSWRAGVAALAAVFLVLIRLIAGVEDYDVWQGLHWNIENPEQVIGFLFITFHLFWLPFLVERSPLRLKDGELQEGVRLFYRSSWAVLSLILVTTFLGGIFNEIRLLHLLAPWMIIPFLLWLQKYGKFVRLTLGTKNYWWYATASFLVTGVLMYFAIMNRERLIPSGRFAVPYEQWIIFSLCYIFATLLFVPLFLKVLSIKKAVHEA